MSDEEHLIDFFIIFFLLKLQRMVELIEHYPAPG